MPAPLSDTQQKQDFKIVLVGVEFEENLSLRYLAGSLCAAGYGSVTILPYNSITEAEAIAASIIREGFDLVGVSMVFQARAIEDMTLVQLLRKQGYKGHITAGGQFATLHYEEIFRDCTGLDSLVRFEAEDAMVLLADALRTASDLHEVPALVWRNEHGQLQVNHHTVAPRDLNQLPVPLRKASRPEYLGLRAVHMIGSRGCHATCKYCCVSALAAERSKASREAGGATALPGTRRRTAANVAAEIAALYFGQNIRIFEFQDDNWIHPKTETALAYFTELKEELARLGVGRIGFSLKTRADSVKPEIMQLLKEMGLIRVFVGIESGTQNLLSKLGRKSRENGSLQALQTLRDYRIPAYFNALLFGPDVKFEDLEPELQFLEQCTDFPYEIVEVVIYGKTGLYLSLKLEQRLFGNYLDYDYAYLEPETQYTYSLVSRLDTRHFGVYSPIKMAADLGFSLGLLQVFYPGSFTNSMAARVAELTRRINEDQVRIIRKAAAFAAQGADFTAAKQELTAETVAADLRFYREIIELQLEIEQYVKLLKPDVPVTAYYRTGGVVQSALVAGLFFLTLGTAEAQEAPATNKELEKKLVNLMQHYSPSEWNEVKEELRRHNSSVSTVLSQARMQVDSLYAPGTGRIKTKVMKENEQHLSKEISKLSFKRYKEDYDRLSDILEEHQPKIKIASSLTFFLDENGRVTDVGIRGRSYRNIFGKRKRRSNKKIYRQFSPELRASILEILKDKEFYAAEARNSISKPPLFRQDSKIGRLQQKAKYKWRRFQRRTFKKHQRRGPMD